MSTATRASATGAGAARAGVAAFEVRWRLGAVGGGARTGEWTLDVRVSPGARGAGSVTATVHGPSGTRDLTPARGGASVEVVEDGEFTHVRAAAVVGDCERVVLDASLRGGEVVYARSDLPGALGLRGGRYEVARSPA